MENNQLMLWNAIYKDGTALTEDVNIFDDIDREQLKYFILDGMDTTFKHNIDTGLVKINENSVIMLLNDTLIGKSSDIINYKEKLKMAIGFNPELESNIIGYYTGWKEKNEDFENIEVLFWVDMLRHDVKVRLRLTPKNIDVLDSTFSMIINGEILTSKLEFPNIMKRNEFVFEIFKGGK